MKRVFLYTDGGARGNPGPAGAGFAIADEGGIVVFEGHRYLGEATNNQAEYMALQLGLEKAVELGATDVLVRMDSELVVKQLSGEYRVKNEGLRPFFTRVKNLLEKFGSYGVEHIPRERNRLADRLVNRAIDEAL